jgi:endonuclease III
MTMAYMEKMPKRDLRKHLLGLGLGSYASAVLMLYLFESHAIPVDQDLVDSLAMEDLIHPGSDIDDVQGFLERVIPQKDAIGAHDFLRLHVEKMSKALAKKRKEDAEAAAKIAAEAAAAAKKIAEAKAAAEAEKAAKAAAKAAAAEARQEAKRAKEAQRASAKAKAAKKSKK